LLRGEIGNEVGLFIGRQQCTAISRSKDGHGRLRLPASRCASACMA
jgi:hypothetical protein